ncbi:MAG TPA: hypothetical protein VKY92_15210 [Verrucomicrobiae bacterium]|nr:hypothetical protein [Verrucomicrobiae bacterium]
MHLDRGIPGYLIARVRIVCSSLVLTTLFLAGCGGHRGGSPGFSEIAGRTGLARDGTQVIMTPDTILVGKVVKVNTEGRFVVLSFPIGHLPVLEQRLGVYRTGLKVGEVRITGPQLDDNVVGDIAAGEARAGDQVRSQ